MTNKSKSRKRPLLNNENETASLNIKSTQVDELQPVKKGKPSTAEGNHQKSSNPDASNNDNKTTMADKLSRHVAALYNNGNPARAADAPLVAAYKQTRTILKLRPDLVKQYQTELVTICQLDDGLMGAVIDSFSKLRLLPNFLSELNSDIGSKSVSSKSGKARPAAATAVLFGWKSNGTAALKSSFKDTGPMQLDKIVDNLFAMMSKFGALPAFTEQLRCMVESVNLIKTEKLALKMYQMTRKQDFNFVSENGETAAVQQEEILTIIRQVLKKYSLNQPTVTAALGEDDNDEKDENSSFYNVLFGLEPLVKKADTKRFMKRVVSNEFVDSGKLMKYLPKIVWLLGGGKGSGTSSTDDNIKIVCEALVNRAYRQKMPKNGSLRWETSAPHVNYISSTLPWNITREVSLFLYRLLIQKLAELFRDTKNNSQTTTTTTTTLHEDLLDVSKRDNSASEPQGLLTTSVIQSVLSAARTLGNLAAAQQPAKDTKVAQDKLLLDTALHIVQILSRSDTIQSIRGSLSSSEGLRLATSFHLTLLIRLCSFSTDVETLKNYHTVRIRDACLDCLIRHSDETLSAGLWTITTTDTDDNLVGGKEESETSKMIEVLFAVLKSMQIAKQKIAFRKLHNLTVQIASSLASSSSVTSSRKTGVGAALDPLVELNRSTLQDFEGDYESLAMGLKTLSTALNKSEMVREISHSSSLWPLLESCSNRISKSTNMQTASSNEPQHQQQRRETFNSQLYQLSSLISVSFICRKITLHRSSAEAEKDGNRSSSGAGAKMEKLINKLEIKDETFENLISDCVNRLDTVKRHSEWKDEDMVALSSALSWLITHRATEGLMTNVAPKAIRVILNRYSLLTTKNSCGRNADRGIDQYPSGLVRSIGRMICSQLSWTGQTVNERLIDIPGVQLILLDQLDSLHESGRDDLVRIIGQNSNLSILTALLTARNAPKYAGKYGRKALALALASASNGNGDEGQLDFDQLYTLLNALLTNYTRMTLTSLMPPFLSGLRCLIHILLLGSGGHHGIDLGGTTSTISNRKRKSDQSAAVGGMDSNGNRSHQNVYSCHLLSRLLTKLSGYKTDVSKVQAYLLASVLDVMYQKDVDTECRIALEAGLAALVRSSDGHSRSFLSTSLPSSLKEPYRNLLERYSTNEPHYYVN